MLNQRKTPGLSEREERLRERIKRSQQNAGKRGLGRASVLDLSAFSPRFYRAKGGKLRNVIDIVPYEITQPWYEKLRTRAGNTTGLKAGDLDYKLEVPVHRSIGPNNDSLLCLREAFGKQCIICEDRFKEYEKGKGERDDELIRSLNASWRCFYNVYDYENDELDEFQIFEAAYSLFEAFLLSEAEPEGDKLEPIPFSSLTHGSTIEWRGKEKQLGKNTFIEATSVEFKARDKYGEDILEKVFPLDKMLIIPTVEAVQKSYLGMENGEEEVEKPAEVRRVRPLQGRAIGRTTEEVADDEVPREDDGGERCHLGFTFGEDHNEWPECAECDDTTFNQCASTKEDAANFKRNVNKTDRPIRKR